MTLTIAVLRGGKSREREASLQTGKAACKAFASFSYNTVEVDFDEDTAENLKKINPDLVFVALHDSKSENNRIQGLLEILGMKYTHSGVMASAIAANKVMSKHIFQSIGIDTPKGYVISREDFLKENIEMDYPYVLKPINEGSSVGVHVVLSHDDYSRLKNDPSDIREEMIIEEYVPGMDLITGVLVDEAVSTVEVRSKNEFLDYGAKTKAGLIDLIFPPKVPENIYNKTLELALKAHRFLGCKSVSRADFRYNPDDDTLKMLEINTHPALYESTFPKMAMFGKGIDFNELFNIIVKDSLSFSK